VDDNPLVRTINKKLADIETFFWDAFVALRVNGISGDYVEFGSWGGNTLRLAYEQICDAGQPRHLWAYDSFEGLPQTDDPRDAHPGWHAGGAGQGGVEQFLLACDAHGVPREAYTAVEGYFDATLPPLGDDGPPTDIALVYLDCNMYSSTVTALEFLSPRLKHGMVIAFDDYWCWSPTDVAGERLAFEEFQVSHPEWRFVRFKEVNWGGLSFVVERADAVAPGP
jgi:O-methyltransferase